MHYLRLRRRRPFFPQPKAKTSRFTYPDMFRAADLLVISKTDLLPHVDFDIDAAIRMARKVQPALTVIRAIHQDRGRLPRMAVLAYGRMQLNRAESSLIAQRHFNR